MLPKIRMDVLTLVTFVVLNIRRFVFGEIRKEMRNP